MAGITRAQYVEVYRLSKLVDAGQLSARDAGLRLSNEFGMNFSSAMGYLRKRKQFLSGQTYTRTVNLSATRFFLEEIFRDEGNAGLAAALKAVRGHIVYYRESSGVGTPGLDALADEFEGRLALPTLEGVQSTFDREVLHSRQLGSDARKKLLPPHGHRPGKLVVTTSVFQRSPHVVAEVLARAAGRCERCTRAAPFKRKSDGSPYLEVHHKMRLAENGPDTVENAEALCPNCHREQHHG